MRSLTLLAALLGAASLAGCHRSAANEARTDAPNEASINRSLGGLQRQLGQLESKFAAMRKQVETVAPDAPGFSQVRAQFYSTEEARGITTARVTLLANRFASASASGRSEELHKISKDIAETCDEVRQIDELEASLSSRVSALLRAQGRNDQAPAGSAPPIARTR